MKREHTVVFEEFSSIQDLDPKRQNLVERAVHAQDGAYAPYSNFNVGAAAELEDGTICTGSNKENASFPAGICAERNVLNYIHDHFPGKKIQRLAISASSADFEITEPLAPCGICRQVICEVEKVQNAPIEIVMVSGADSAIVVASGKDLLPLHFYLPELKK